jgi:hypothetical protein
MKIKTSSVVFCEIWTSKIAPNGRWVQDTVLLEEKEEVFIQKIPQAVG